MKNKKSIQINIAGRVQNVGFRYHTQEKAKQLGINGFVQNQANGNVYIEAEAAENILTQFATWCKKGPDWAKVTDIRITEQPLCGFASFEIRKSL